jgi:hypothetical protein
MANTIISLKKSGVAGNTPVSLSYGELALNYADGKLYYLDSTNSINNISTGTTTDSFSTINANSSLVLATSPTDILTLLAGENVTIDANVTTKAITISANTVQEQIARDYQKYFYTISANTSTISGADNNSNTLAYDVHKLDVYQNGIRLVEGLDYTAINGSSITFVYSLKNGDFIEVLSYGRAYLADITYIENGYANLTACTSNQIVDTFDKTEYRTVKYMVQAIQGSNVHCTEVVLTHNDSDVFKSEYGVIYTNDSLITVSATINSSNVSLIVTPTYTNTIVDFVRTSLIARTLV